MTLDQKIVVACDASCYKKAGIGYIIWGNDALGVKHKIICRLLDVEFNSNYMELATVLAALELPPEGSDITLVNDCELMRNIEHHRMNMFLNVKGLKPPHFQLLERIHLLKEKRKLKVTVVSKSSHPWHEMCHNGCIEFRENINRGDKMYELYSLDSDFKATLISRHLTKARADFALKERFFYKTDRTELRTFIALAKKPERKVKDLNGFVWSIK